MRKDLVICGSMGNYGAMEEIANLLTEAGIPCRLPDVDRVVSFDMSANELKLLKKTSSFAHFQRIRNAKTYGILVVNFDRHGIANYVGPNTFAEIGVAFAQRKKIFLLQGIPVPFEEELVAWDVKALEGNLGYVMEMYETMSFYRYNQPSLFSEK